MRSKLLVLAGLAAAFAIPTTGHANVGGIYQVSESVTFEADVVVPIKAHLTITTRTRRFVLMNLNTSAPPGTMPTGNLEERSSSVELVSTDPTTPGLRLCRSDAPMASVTVSSQDAMTAGTTDISCPLDVEVTASGQPMPFVRNLATPGRQAENGVDTGYERDATVDSAMLGGISAELENATLTRTFRLAATPYAAAQ
jgi:hypothetical protein